MTTGAYKTIAQRLSFARWLSGLSASELGIRSGLSKGAVSVIETNPNAKPRGDTVAKLAETLGVSTDWLLTGAGEDPTPETIRRHETEPPSADDSEPASEPKPKAAPKDPPVETKAAG